MPHSIRVLHVDADAAFADAVSTALERESRRISVRTATGVRDALDAVESDAVDCVLSDRDAPRVDGLELLAAVREVDPRLPFILLTAEGSEAVAIEAISAGVTDYVRKDDLSERPGVLANRIVKSVEAARTERELDRRRELLRHTERLADTGGWEADLETGNQRWTRGLFEIHGIDPDEGAVPTVEEYFSFVDPDHREGFQRTLERCLERAEPYDEEVEITAADGRTRWIRTIGEPVVKNGEPVAYRGVARDITDRKRRERRLAELAEFREAIIESANVWINVLDTEGNVAIWNEAAARISGYPAAEVVGHNGIWAWLYPDEAYRAEITEDAAAILRGEKEAREYVTMIRTRDGEERTLAWHSRSIETADDERLGSVAIARDITEQRRNLEQLNRKTAELERQNARLEEFASIVSHDLRNPLNVATGWLDLAQEECESEHLEVVAEALDRSQELIDDLLVLAREGAQVGAFESVELDVLVHDCWRTVDTAEATLVTDLDCVIRADRSRLRQLFENLLRNAVEHGGEAVTVTVEEVDGGFAVEDDGRGVPSEHHDRLFEAGYSTSRSGTGFGLRIVEQIAEAHGWEVDVADGADGGARFELTGVDVVR
ncbi:PAS domain S-box protein [Natronobeatus ordinarius]|uniref:PAS domain S-box protein n=1 Tax=Natronobeatus ordinarius TaxID=2963433 RepID=UPI0020CCD996|nr:PAS domain S-box protein [Natronobeatus ordinarius]